MEVFNSKGSDSLGIPPPPSECPVAPSIEPNMTKQEKYEVHKLKLALKRRKAEMYSLWCDALYRLSLANHVSTKELRPFLEFYDDRDFSDFDF